MKRKSLLIIFLMALGLVSLGSFSAFVAAGPTPAAASSITVYYRTSKNPLFRPLPAPVSPTQPTNFRLDGQKEIGDYWGQKDTSGVPNGFLAIAVVANGGTALTNLSVNYNAQLFPYLGLPSGSEYTTLSGIRGSDTIYNLRAAKVARQNIALFPNGSNGSIAFYRTRVSHVVSNGSLSFTIPGTGPGFGTYSIYFADDSLLTLIGNPCPNCPPE
jgi:hypothetical protein